MSEPEIIGEIIPKTLAMLDDSLNKKILHYEIFKHWREIVGPFADRIFPSQIDGDTLVIFSNDSSAKDYFKYAAQNFIDRINEKIGNGDKIITALKFGRSYNPPPAGSKPKKKPAPVALAEVELTDAEYDACEEKVAAIENPDSRQIILQTLISHAKSEKSKLQRGWHKCALCNLLCEPQKKICSSCTIKERERMQREIRLIFKRKPETPFRTIQKKITAEFPYLPGECTLSTIDAARMSLILQTAALVSYGDTTSERARFLVRLICQLPDEKLTPAIIERALRQFQFNLADQPKFEDRKIKKMPANFRQTKKSAAQPE